MIGQIEEKHYVVCPDCCGFFKRNFLRRHRKSCEMRSTRESKGRENHLTEAQIFSSSGGLHNIFYNSLRLKQEVFININADEISTASMKDILICSYAESLLGKHKRKQTRKVVSNKMRELERQLKRMTGVCNMSDILKREYYDNIVGATKIGYDPETKVTVHLRMQCI